MRLKSGKKLGDWLPAMQLKSVRRRVDPATDVEGYVEE
jgi:hypothetical protein